jgi:hypothetical protein
MRPIQLTRRAFVSTVAVTGAALSAGACDDSSTEGDPNGASGSGPGSGSGAGNPAGNQAPVWQRIPAIQFAEGVAGSISIAAFVSDVDGDELAITKNEVALPPGVTYDAAGKRFVYDGIGGAGFTNDHVLTADDGNS